MRPPPLVIFFILLGIQDINGLRCWVCGDTAELYNTDPTDPNRKNFDVGSNSWCSSMVTSATCIPKAPGDEVFCYKEIWLVDGSTMVKRGCARKDKRYELMGCEEQLTGPGSFMLTLCLCNESYCNSAFKCQRPTTTFLVALILTHLLRMFPYS